MAVIKAVAGLLAGSSAMLAESAHSTADTLNQVFLLTSRVAFSDSISADQAEDLADDVDRRLGLTLDVITHVFIDPTQAP